MIEVQIKDSAGFTVTFCLSHKAARAVGLLIETKADAEERSFGGAALEERDVSAIAAMGLLLAEAR